MLPLTTLLPILVSAQVTSITTFAIKKTLSCQYTRSMRNLLIDTMPEVSPDVKPLDAIILYMDAVFQTLMKFRFFYSNLPVLLAKNPLLHDKYVEVQDFIAQRVSELLLSLRDANMMEF